MHSTSNLATMLWKKRIENNAVRVSASATRWWSKYECEADLIPHDGDLLPFLKNDLCEIKTGTQQHAEVSPAHRACMLQLLEGEDAVDLKKQQAACQDAGGGLVKSTYNTEAEGAVITAAYQG